MIRRRRDPATLWCPFVHVSTRPDTDNYPPDTITSRGNFITGVDSPEVAEQCMCIGNKCMAWHPDTDSCALIGATLWQ
jgi:hypothetical protein